MRKFPDQMRVFITGAGSGLGRALALKLAAPGVRLLLSDINSDSATETATMVALQGAITEVLRCDVTQAEDLAQAAAKMISLWGGTDLLINNAGVAVAGTVGDVRLEDWEWVVRINMWGMIYGCHQFIPQMREQQGGWILNVASNAGLVTLPEMAPYNVSKAAVIALSETLRSELRPFGISVSVLCPTFFQTNLMSSFRSSDVRQRKLAEYLFRRASLTVEQVAEYTLRKTQRRKLYIIPQRDGRLGWRMKRWLPEFFYNQMGRGYSSRMITKLRDQAWDSPGE